MYELQIKENGVWEAYPDPLRETEARAEEKIAYLREYEIKNNMERQEMRIVKLGAEGIKKHNEEWDRWCSMID